MSIDFDPEAFGEAIGDLVREAVAPLRAKIADLEKQISERPDIASLVATEVGKAVSAIPAPRDGKDADMKAIGAMLDEAVKAIPAPKDGKDADMETIGKMIRDAVQALPKPQDGKSITMEDMRPVLDDAVRQLRTEADEAIKEPLQQVEAARDALFKAVGELRQPEDGKSVTLDDVQPVIQKAIQRIEESASAAAAKAEEAAVRLDAAIAAIRQPEDGKSVTLDDVRPILNEAVKSIREEALERIDLAVKSIPVPKDGRDGKDGKDGQDGKDGAPGQKGADGVGMAGALLDRDGNLLLTLSNGEVKTLGIVVGKDGKDGQDGKDGASFETFEMEYLPETHEISIKAECAGRMKTLLYPAGGIRPAGYWREGTKAKAGDAWVHDGSLWIAMKDTQAKPEAKGSDWIIAARRGRDGERGPKGMDGAPPAPIKLKG